MDHIVVRVLTRIFDLLLLNVLWLLCSLPVITVGAATTALYTVTLKMAGDEEGYIAKDFFKAFRENFRKSTFIWMGLLLIGIILGLDFVIVQGISGVIGDIGMVLLGIIGVLYVIELIFVFPLLARFENTVRNTVVNAVLIPVSALPYAAAVICLTAMCVIVTLLNQFTIMAGAVIWSVIGAAVLAFANSFLLRAMFKKLFKTC